MPAAGRPRNGTTGTQPSRIIGINGPRWMLRATLLGRPATDVDGAAEWEDTLTQVAVRRGAPAMPVGDLPCRDPPGEARRVDDPRPRTPRTRPMLPEKSRLRRNLSRWANSSDQHARDLRKTYAESGVATIAELPTGSASGCAGPCGP